MESSIECVHIKRASSGAAQQTTEEAKDELLQWQSKEKRCTFTREAVQPAEAHSGCQQAARDTQRTRRRRRRRRSRWGSSCLCVWMVGGFTAHRRCWMVIGWQDTDETDSSKDLIGCVETRSSSQRADCWINTTENRRCDTEPDKRQLIWCQMVGFNFMCNFVSGFTRKWIILKRERVKLACFRVFKASSLRLVAARGTIEHSWNNLSLFCSRQCGCVQTLLRSSGRHQLLFFCVRVFERDSGVRLLQIDSFRKLCVDADNHLCECWSAAL